jgi:hypothetical protein
MWVTHRPVADAHESAQMVKGSAQIRGDRCRSVQGRALRSMRSQVRILSGAFSRNRTRTVIYGAGFSLSRLVRRHAARVLGRGRNVTTTWRGPGSRAVRSELSAIIHDKSDGAQRSGASAASCRLYVPRSRSGPIPGLIVSELSAQAAVVPRWSHIAGIIPALRPTVCLG